MRNIVNGQYTFLPNYTPNNAKILVKKLLNTQANERPEVAQILEDPLIAQKVKEINQKDNWNS